MDNYDEKLTPEMIAERDARNVELLKSIEQQRTANPAPTEPERLMTLDEARAMVARSTAVSVARSIEEFSELKTKSETAEKNKQLLLHAARELGTTLIAQARKFDRPLILRPERRVKVVR